MQTERVPLGSVRKNGDNPRTISEAKLNRLVDSLLISPRMQEIRSVVVDGEAVVLGGNMRLRALERIAGMDAAVLRERLEGIRDYQRMARPAREELLDYWLGWLETPTVEIARADFLTEEERRQFIIKDNVAFGQWDFEALGEQFTREELESWGMDDWEEPIEEIPETIEEEGLEEVEVPLRVREGELWQLGKHFLLCGDSTKPEDMRRLMGGAIADLLITDPPYNVDYQGGGGRMDREGIKNDRFETASAFQQLLAAAFRNADSVLKAGAAFYIWHSYKEAENFTNAMREVGWASRQVIMWAKNHFVMGRSDYQPKHEPCFYGWKDGAAHYFAPDRTQTTIMEALPRLDEMPHEELVRFIRKHILFPDRSSDVWRENMPKRNELHPTMKPVNLLIRSIRNSSRRGERVLDIFGGSGSTLIACERKGRICHTMELDPRYASAIVARWEEETGGEAVNLGMGDVA